MASTQRSGLVPDDEAADPGFGRRRRGLDWILARHPRAGSASRDSKHFARALEEFEQSLSPDVTPAWLARRSKLSSQRLARLTKRLFNLTPNQFITKSRIAAASRTLRNSDQSVAEIAHACGFYDHSAFTRAFRSATGMTPSVFRTQQ